MIRFAITLGFAMAIGSVAAAQAPALSWVRTYHYEDYYSGGVERLTIDLRQIDVMKVQPQRAPSGGHIGFIWLRSGQIVVVSEEAVLEISDDLAKYMSR